MSAPETAPARFALWDLGFRPFYLLASSFAALSIALWALQVTGWLDHRYLAGSLWHAHEMVFGFVLAVIVGFLLTAGQNWAGLPTTTRTTLKLLVVLWIAGRVLVLTPFGWLAAMVTVAFPLAAAIALAVPFYKARIRRNYFFPGLLVLLAGADLWVHLSALGVIAQPGSTGIQFALDVVLLVMAIMGGRVIPMFTNNGVRGAGATRHPRLEQLALGSIIVLLIVDVLQPPAIVVATVAIVAALLHLARLALWRPWTTLRVPLVWVLHAAYLWIPVYLLLRAASALNWLAPGIATHALTVGAIGCLTIGMMTRTARGHTGRLLVADRWEVICYLSIFAAAVVRVFGPVVLPAAYAASVLVAAALWSTGFALYAIRYWPVLSRGRLDGRPG